ncbi:MAG: hypothetical protein JSV19_05115 [Phycisphaerales bacterium]|nr:MAG: hypothetical protein JSV19_05115 [Phycisphaerales bacterium]
MTITGGADVSGHNYEWTVTNHHSSPIVLVQFPHYMADVFTPPDGWTSEMTNPLGKGVCSVESVTGLPTGRSVTVGLRVAPRGAFRGRGNVLVRFADDTEVLVPAEMPTKEPFIRRNIPVIGLGLAFGAFLLVRALKKRKPRPLSSNGEP